MRRERQWRKGRGEGGARRRKERGGGGGEQGVYGEEGIVGERERDM